MAAMIFLTIIFAILASISGLPTNGGNLYKAAPERWQRAAHVTLDYYNPRYGMEWRVKRFQVHEGLPPRDPVTGEMHKNIIAWALFANETVKNGWNLLEVNSQQTAIGTDADQAYAAGFVEGSITADMISQYWNNTIGTSWEAFCGPDPTYCKKLNETLTSNLEFMAQTVVEKWPPEPYFHQVGLVLNQLAGLEDGYFGRVGTGPRLDIDPMGLYLLNLFGDLEDIQTMLNVSTGGDLNAPIHPPRSLVEGTGRCSGLIKLLPGNKDMFISHVSWNTYQSMNRLIKNYDIPVSVGSSIKDIVPGRKSAFSSYPGVLFSGDDFYILSSNLSVVETTLGNGNDDLYREQYKLVNQSIWEFIRNIIANRLATTGAEWAEYFTLRNSGTYNNQFMVLDWNKFQPGSPTLEDGLLTVVEQIPLYVATHDATDTLRKQAYWPSYNLPYDPFIFNMSGVEASVQKYGDWFSYDKHPRAQIFKRDVSKVVDMNTMVKLMRYNDYTHDPLAQCDCKPVPYSAENAISARSDLNAANGTYPFSALAHRGHGGIDVKVTSYEMMQNYEMMVQGGPTWDQVPVFQWSKSGDLETLGHVGQPDVWQFDPVHIVWFPFKG